MAEKIPHYDTVDGSGSANPPPYYAGPAPGAYPYPPGSQGPAVVQVTAFPAMVPVHVLQPMGPQSTRTTCKFCNHEVMTRIETTATSKTHLMALVLFLLGCWCCCCIPYCVDSCMKIDHYCPNCNAFLGSYDS